MSAVPRRPPRPGGPRPTRAGGPVRATEPRTTGPRTTAPRTTAPRTTAPRTTGHRRTVEEVSAGGLVVDHSGGEPRAAVIARVNRGGRLEWCLPKGHLEGDETPEQAAVREIEEETGIRGRVITGLGSIDYWFSVDDRRIHKTVHHFLLEATGGDLTVENDPDAEAVDVAWVPLTDLGTRLAFSNERRILRAARELLADTA